jgi:hypothetical protein
MSPPDSGTPAASTQKTESGYYEPYADYHRNLRLWFLAYGIGMPVFLTQVPEAISALKTSGALRMVMALFLAGVIVQVFTALLYKTAMWYLYVEELGDISGRSKRVRVSNWLSEAYWLEALFDATTLLCFGYATWCVIQVST